MILLLSPLLSKRQTVFSSILDSCFFQDSPQREPNRRRSKKGRAAAHGEDATPASERATHEGNKQKRVKVEERLSALLGFREAENVGPLVDAGGGDDAYNVGGARRGEGKAGSDDGEVGRLCEVAGFFGELGGVVEDGVEVVVV